MGLNFFCSVQKAFIIVLTAPMTDVIPLITSSLPYWKVASMVKGPAKKQSNLKDCLQNLDKFLCRTITLMTL